MRNLPRYWKKTERFSPSTSSPGKAEVLRQLVRVVLVFFDINQELCHHYAVKPNRLRTLGKS